MKKKLRPATIGLIITLIITICLSLLNWAIVSNGGDVKVKRLRILGTDGLTYSALMYVPSNATDATPAPAIIMFHGGAGNARNHESWSVEFARRGYVCLAVDWNGSGESEAYGAGVTPGKGDATGVTRDYWGIYENIPSLWMKYLMEVPCVDKDNIITSGHSMGTTPAAILASRYQLKAALLASGTGGSKNFKNYEGAALVTVGAADIDSTETAINNMSYAAWDMGFLPEGEKVALDTVYGSFESGKVLQTARIPGQVHEGAFIKKATIGTLLDFAQKAVSPVKYIDANNQVWVWKDVVGQLGMISFVCMLIALFLFLIDQMPSLAVLKQPVPRNIGLRGVGMAIAVVASIAFPLLCMKTGSFGLLTALNKASIFNMGHANKAMAMVLGISILGFIMLMLYYFTDGKKHNANLYDLGLGSAATGKLNWVMIGKAFLTAVVVITAGWSYLSLQTAVLGTDFYCLFWGYKPLCTEKFVQYIPYIVCWIPCFAVSAIGINVEKRLPSTGKERLDTAIAIVFNVVLSVGVIAFIVLLQQSRQLAQNGTVDGQAMANWAIDITRLYGMPVNMSIGVAGNTYLYRKTGSIWPGVFLMSLICALGAVSYGSFKMA